MMGERDEKNKAKGGQAMAAVRALPQHIEIEPSEIRDTLERIPGKHHASGLTRLQRRVVNVPRSLRTYELRWRRSGQGHSARAWMAGSIVVTAVYLPMLVLPLFSGLYIHDWNFSAERFFARLSLLYFWCIALMTFFFIIYAPSAGMVRLICNPDASIDGRFRFWGVLKVRSDRIRRPLLIFTRTVGDSSRLTTAERYAMFLCDRDGKKAVLLARSRDASHIAECYERFPDEIRSSAPCAAIPTPVKHFGSGNWH